MITVRVWHVLYRHCDHCGERTAHVGIEGRFYSLPFFTKATV